MLEKTVPYSQEFVLSTLKHFDPCSDRPAFDTTQCEKLQSIVKKFLELFENLEYCAFLQDDRGGMFRCGRYESFFNKKDLFRIRSFPSLFTLSSENKKGPSFVCERDKHSAMNCDGGEVMLRQLRNNPPQCHRMTEKDLNCWHELFHDYETCWLEAGFSTTVPENLADFQPNCIEDILDTFPKEKAPPSPWKWLIGGAIGTGALFLAYKKNHSADILQRVKEHVRNKTYVLKGSVKTHSPAILHILEHGTLRLAKDEWDAKRKVWRHAIAATLPDGKEAVAWVEFEKDRMIVT